MDPREFAQPGGDYRRQAGKTRNNYSVRNHIAPAVIKEILSRLDGVKSAGADRWIARCSAHDDRSPSLSIRNTGDRILIHCYAGCAPEAVVEAIGLTLADLYADALPAGERRERAVQASRRDLEAAINHELLVLAQTLGNRVTDRQIDRDRMPEGWAPVPPGHWEREVQAAKRLVELFRLIYGRELAGEAAS